MSNRENQRRNLAARLASGRITPEEYAARLARQKKSSRSDFGAARRKALDTFSAWDRGKTATEQALRRLDGLLEKFRRDGVTPPAEISEARTAILAAERSTPPQP